MIYLHIKVQPLQQAHLVLHELLQWEVLDLRNQLLGGDEILFSFRRQKDTNQPVGLGFRVRVNVCYCYGQFVVNIV